MILGKGQLKEAKEIKNILQSYGVDLAEMVNKEKQEIFFFNIEAQEEYKIDSYLGYKIGHLPISYLGMPLDKGIKTNKLWDPLIEKVRKKLSSWKTLWLTGAGRLTLIKTILVAMPIYLLSCIPLPKGAYKKLTQIIRDFYQNGVEDKKKMKLISWENICQEKSDGGTKIRKLLWQNKALWEKLAWTMYTSSEAKWNIIFRRKYISQNQRETIFRETNPPKGSRIQNFIK